MEVKKIPSPGFDRRNNQLADGQSSAARSSDAPQNVDADYVNRQLLVLLEALAGMSETGESHRKQGESGFKSHDVIEAVQLFFDSILTSEHCSSAVMTLVGMLQMPVLKSAAKSDRFLTDHRHPARRLIKALFVVANDIDLVRPASDSPSSADSQSDSESNSIYRSLLDIVKTVMHDYDGDDRIFLKAYFDVCQLQGSAPADAI